MFFGYPNAQGCPEIGPLFLRNLRTRYLAYDVHGGDSGSYSIMV